MKLNKNLMSGALAFGLILGLAACAESVKPANSPQQEWIDAHPTHAGPDGQCIEFDNEPCDDDPYDWFATYNHGLPSAKPSSVKPSPVKLSPFKPVAPVKTPGPVKTTKRR